VRTIICGIFATLGKNFALAILRGDFFVPLSPTSNIRGRCMSIEAVLLIVIVTFAIGHLLNRLDTGRPRVRRSDSPRGGMWGGRR
jgi:hypothetical protein